MDNAFKFAYKWSRPLTVPFPHVWHRFQAKFSNGKSYNARIEDLTADRYDEVWQFFAQYYFQDEPIAKALRLTDDEASIASLARDYYTVMKQNASLIAVLDEPGPRPKLMAAHLKVVVSKDEPLEPPPETVNSPEEKYNYICINFREGVDVFREFDCDNYFDDYGLCVVPEFRHMGVAENMLIASVTYGTAFKIRGEFVTMVNPTLRSVAQKLGFQTFREVKIKDLKDKNGNPLIPDSDLESLYLGGCKFY